MSIHLHYCFITRIGVASNNRGESEGNLTTLKKIQGFNNGPKPNAIVSSETQRHAYRRFWQQQGLPLNRTWDEVEYNLKYKDKDYTEWSNPTPENTYIDDDILGFMNPDAASEESEVEIEEVEETAATKKPKGKKKTAKKAMINKGKWNNVPLVSTRPYIGDKMFNAKSGVTKDNTSLYNVECITTRFVGGGSVTIESLIDPNRFVHILDAIVHTSQMAGNNSRFLYDYSPESIVFRVTHDPAPRILYCFGEDGYGNVTVEKLLTVISSGDIVPSELFIGGEVSKSDLTDYLDSINLFTGVKNASEAVKEEIGKALVKA